MIAFNIMSIGALVICVLGLISGLLIFRSYRRLSGDDLRGLLLWLFITVMCCGFPYALWNFLIESGIVVIQDAFIRQLPGMILVTLFFVFILRSAWIAKKIGEQYGFKEQGKKAMESLKKSK